MGSTIYREMNSNQHFLFLDKSYKKVGNKTWNYEDFQDLTLKSSRNLFTESSLMSNNPIPKKLEVYALLSGLPFENHFSIELLKIQKKIDEILDGALRYWVLQDNFGLEYCVFKWPENDWEKKWEYDINNELPVINKPFKFIIFGIQINSDGCVIAKGFDERAEVFNLRKKLKEKLDFYPNRQSGWAHVPLGRILEPVGKSKFIKLNKLCIELSNLYITSCEINTIKFVHERQWYMEDKDVLNKFNLFNQSQK
jgi:hypothetical protein